MIVNLARGCNGAEARRRQWRNRRGMPRLLARSARTRARPASSAARARRLARARGQRRRPRHAHRPDEVIERLEAAGIKAVPTGIAHGTVTAVIGGQPVEVTTLRRDVSTDGRRATIAYTDDWREDAARRDFTINALERRSRRRRDLRLFRRPRGSRGAARALHRRPAGSASPRTICGSCASSASMPASARASPTRPALEACAARANDLMALSRERIADELLKLLGLPDPAPTVALMIERGDLQARPARDRARPRCRALSA